MNEQNLKPFQPGYDPRRAKGKPKGAVNLSTRIKNLLGEEDLADGLLKKKPDWWSLIKDKDMASAIIIAMIAKAVDGDTKAAEFIRRAGYGDKLDVTSGDKPIQPIAIYDLREHGNSGNRDGDDNQADSEHQTGEGNGGGAEPSV